MGFQRNSVEEALQSEIFAIKIAMIPLRSLRRRVSRKDIHTNKTEAKIFGRTVRISGGLNEIFYSTGVFFFFRL